jgi:hypothetical protein
MRVKLYFNEEKKCYKLLSSETKLELNFVSVYECFVGGRELRKFSHIIYLFFTLGVSNMYLETTLKHAK